MSVARVSTHDGLSLTLEHHDVPDPRARLVLVHGYAEHRGRYGEVARQLLARGIECHLFDLRGHGESDGERGHVARFTDYVDDLDRVANTVRARGGATPLLVMAHSLGGLIALSYVRAHPDVFDAIAVSSPFLGPAFAVPAARAMLARAVSVAAPSIKFDSGLAPEWVSRDPETVAAYTADPHVFSTTTPRWYTEVTAAQRELLAHADEIKTPALFLIAGSDRIADHHLAHDFFNRLGTPATDKELHSYPDLYHEILNELPAARAEVTKDLLRWIEQRVAG
ncbi:MAG TPA: alpha/beta hydrolase [Thermoanaerobaculia bacterium]|nr:alpha/beta hydrolase [Thermoanaerobaculia bacterium]